ncbi:PilZ domain-containing protein [Methylobacterium sp. E-005]|uniref:PilZ domain-containing protein n=1 Tax=Methylobacterium sp. E-005 TaxID=2836549 RepID=UPI001FBB79CC|nr:PilZ domain-containing protein [Methylobacterium sp. E-005]MCJ2086947.1 PilZ domain-containing protein [Methylobacterium sp. E-005]
MTERRTIPRHAIILPALCWHADGSEFHAVTVDISGEGICMRSATIPALDAQLGCSIRGVGSMEIRVVRTGAADFAVRVMGRGATPGEVVRSLVGLARLQAPPSEDVRVSRRVVPNRRTVQVALADGTSAAARIVNLSASGVALQLDVPMEVGQMIVVGRHRAKVARRIDGGVGAAFLVPLDDATVGENTVL